MALLSSYRVYVGVCFLYNVAMQKKYKKYVDELNKMVEVDQKLRSGDDIDWDGVEKVDKEHTKKVEAIIREIGFPIVSKVGKQANANAWLLVQHSPDVGFMKEYLAMMEEQDEGEYDKKHYAYLEDRILLHEKKPQIYGTQTVVNDKTGKFELWKVEDEEKLGERREKMGLEPIDEYMKNFE